MNKNIPFGFALPLFAPLFCAALLASCASAPSVPGPEQDAPPPEWFLDVGAVYPREKFLAEKGRGASAGEAEIAGSRAIARYISSQINTELRETSVAASGRATETTLTDTTFIQSQMELFALHYAKAWFNKAENVWETIAYIERDEAWEMYEPKVREEISVFLNLYDTAVQESDPLKRFALFSGARNYYELNAASVRKFAERLHPRNAAESFAEIQAALSELPGKTDEARAQAVIFIDCANDYETRVTQALEKCLNDEGFRVAKNRDAAAGLLTVTVSENETEQAQGNNAVFYVFVPSLQAVLSSSGGVIFSYTSPPVERATAMNRDVGKRRAYTALAQKVRDSFPAEFREGLASFSKEQRQ
ncbi:MAG: hypothetical protein LBR23_10015 [Spirochaetaceae bacterium]|jgi:hypothetical protein|nr:hypothetical protein [Spirochaetaceae bacterium]